MTSKDKMDDTTMKELEKKVEKRVEEALQDPDPIIRQGAEETLNRIR